jgi:uncharacterized membrane protein YqjE
VSQTTPGVGATTPNGSRASGRRPLGSVVSSLLDGVRSLIRKEVELAKIEVTEAIGVRAKGVGLMVAAGVFALFALVFIAVAGAAALDLVLPRWAANLIVGGVFLLIALIVFLAGRSAMKNAPSPQKTQETLKEDARWAKQQIGK